MVTKNELRIAIICPDLEGPIRNGGVGTANTALARLLAAQGHELHLLLTTPPERGNHDWQSRYADSGIRTYDGEVWRTAHDVPTLYPDHPDVSAAYLAFLWTQEIMPDLIIVPDWKGHGFFVASAQMSPPVLVVAHGPSMWHDLGNASLPTHPDEILRYYLERKSLEFADVVVSPSQYMVEWLAGHGYKTINAPVVIPNPIAEFPDAYSKTNGGEISGVTFFGRLEERKGLRDFCDALDILSSSGRAPAEITFMGKIGMVGDLPADKYLGRRMSSWNSRIQVLTGLDSTSAVFHISDSNSLAVVPSLIDNSPYTIVEAVRAQIPLLAKDVGGVGELLDTETRSFALYSGGAPALAQAMVQRLGSGAQEQRLKMNAAAVAARWAQQVASSAVPRCEPGHVGPLPTISVCLIHHDRPALVKEAVRSLLQQTDSDFEVILVDDGSSAEARAELHQLAPIFAQRQWEIVYSSNNYLGAARNIAASMATGEYLLFMDDDNLANPSLISTFRAAASTSSADFLACAFDVFEDERTPGGSTPGMRERFVPLGPAWAESASRNVLGDANSLVRAKAFHDAGGFTEDRGVGSEDYELFTRLMIREATFAIIPEALFRYRRHGQSMSLQTSRLASEARRVRPYVEELPAHWHEVVLAARLARPLENINVRTTKDTTWNGLPSDLIAQGRADLAASVLETWDASDADAAAGRLGLEMLNQILTGDRAELLGARAHPDIPADRVLGALRDALRAARHARHPVEDLLAVAAEVVRNVDATPLARVEALAEIFISTSAEQASSADFQVLGQAIRTASRAYADRRPDIARSIDGVHVVSSLDHYERWGAVEGIPWPELDALVATVPGSDAVLWPELRAMAPEQHRPELERFLRMLACNEV